MKKINFDFIPTHLNCTNCRECCGPVPIDDDEFSRIYFYCKANNVKPIVYLDYTCPFRDEKNKKCMIYDVRPTICKLFGVTEGMSCKNGNTCNMDGLKFMKLNKDIKGMSKLAQVLLENK